MSIHEPENPILPGDADRTAPPAPPSSPDLFDDDFWKKALHVGSYPFNNRGWTEPRQWVGPWMGYFIITIGNLLFHLFSQDWRLIPDHAPSGLAWLALVGTIFIVGDIGKDLMRRNLSPYAVVLPSVIFGITGLMALVADIPGIASWTPFGPQANFVSELELFLLPCATLGQLFLYAKALRENGH